MRRTNPTYRDSLRAMEEWWADFHRALHRRDQPYFDRLFQYAHKHTDASGVLNHQNLLPALLSIDLEQEARLDHHEERLATLYADIQALQFVCDVAETIENGDEFELKQILSDEYGSASQR